MNPSLVAQRIKRLPAMRETRVWSLGWEDPLEKGMATHSRILAWRIPWTEEPGGLHSPSSHKELHTTEQLTLSRFLFFFFTYISVLKLLILYWDFLYPMS